KVSVRELEELGEQAGCPLARDAALLDDRDRVRALRQPKAADVVVVLHLERAGADHLAPRRVPPATATAAAARTRPLDEEALLMVLGLDETGLPGLDYPPVGEIAVEVVQE